MKEADPYRQIARLGRDGIELWAEYTAATDARERRILAIEVHALEKERQEYTEQIEALAQVPAVWETIYGEGDGFVALFSGLRAHKKLAHPQARYFPYPDALDQAYAWVRSAAAAGREVYHCAHLVTERRRRKETAAPLSALWVDLDQGQLDSQLVPTPSLMVESSPGRSQCYWRLTAPIEPARGERLNRHLAGVLGADKSGWDATQLLRVPGTRNHKYVDAPLVRVLAHRGQHYDPAAVATPLGDVPRFTARREEPRPTTQSAATGSATLQELPLTRTARRI